LKLIGTLAIIAAGYLVAVIVATVVTVLIYTTPMALPDQGAIGSIYGWWHEAAPFFSVGSFYTFVFALPGFIAAVAIGERFKWNGWGKYSLAGAIDAVAAHILIEWPDGHDTAHSGEHHRRFCRRRSLLVRRRAICRRPAQDRHCYFACAIRILSAKAEKTPANR